MKGNLMNSNKKEEKNDVAVFTNFTNDSNWVYGTCGGYTFEAKLFDEDSYFGINDGRVSKLTIYPKDGSFFDAVVNYDRGWDVRPNTYEKKIFNQIMKLLENSPKRFS